MKKRRINKKIIYFIIFIIIGIVLTLYIVGYFIHLNTGLSDRDVVFFMKNDMLFT